MRYFLGVHVVDGIVAASSYAYHFYDGLVGFLHEACLVGKVVDVGGICLVVHILIIQWCGRLVFGSDKVGVIFRS